MQSVIRQVKRGVLDMFEVYHVAALLGAHVAAVPFLALVVK